MCSLQNIHEKEEKHMRYQIG